MSTLRVPSPFDHAAQAALYIPHDLPEPADPAYTPALADAVARWTSRLGGRTLVLTTTLRAASRMAGQLNMLVAQGRLSKRALLARFRAAAEPRPGMAAVSRGVVLVASVSFWESVDLAGDVLQLLVIDKLPFPPPDDPLIEVRAIADRRLLSRSYGHRLLAGLPPMQRLLDEAEMLAALDALMLTRASTTDHPSA